MSIEEEKEFYTNLVNVCERMLTHGMETANNRLIVSAFNVFNSINVSHLSDLDLNDIGELIIKAKKFLDGKNVTRAIEAIENNKEISPI